MEERNIDRLEAPLLQLLGLEPCFRPHEECPPVDAAKIERFHRGELTPYASDDVMSAIRLYRNWYDAWAAVVSTEVSPVSRSPKS